MNTFLSILLVEDNPGDVDLIREMLTETGPVSFSVESVQRLSEAMARLKSNDIDLVLLDLGLPDSSGLDTLIKMRAVLSEMPIIILTGNTDQEAADAAVRAGAQDFLIKGQISGGLIARAICYALERKNAENTILASLRLSQFAPLHSLDELLQETLDEAEKMTGSQIGFYHFLEADQRTLSLQMWSTRTLQEMCKAEGKGLHYDIDQAGVWVDCVRERRPVMHNDYSALPHRKGMPAGHANVIRELVVPVFRSDVIVAILGVGNKPNDYDESDVRTISFFADIAWDVAERKKAEEKLRESQARYEATVHSANDAIVSADSSGSIINWNLGAEQIFGYTEAEVIGQPLTLMMPSRYRDGHLDGMKRVQTGGEHHVIGKTVVQEGLRKDGSEIAIELSLAEWEFNKSRCYTGIIRDITERKKLEAQLRQAQKMEAVGQLAGGIAHDFNNILSAIIGYGYVTLMKMAQDDPLRSNIEQMLTASDRAAELTKSILAFSRKQILDKKPTELNGLVRKVEKYLSRVIGEDITIKLTLSESGIRALADSGQLEQVFMNLATNARDAMPKGGTLSIETSVAELDDGFIREHGYGNLGKFAVISVSDSGTGMDEETRKQIFEPFFSTKEVGKGTGLGLAMVYGIIKQHDGYINVYSEPGKGTTFRIYLSLMETAVGEEEMALEAEHPERGSETILFAEDNKQLRKFTASVLQEFGYTVIVADNGDDAVNKFKENRESIRLLLFDLVMPKKSGKDAYDEIRAIQPDVRILFMSGYAHDIIRQKGLTDNDTPIVSKPVSPVDLLKKIRSALDG